MEESNSESDIVVVILAFVFVPIGLVVLGLVYTERIQRGALGLGVGLVAIPIVSVIVERLP